MLLGRPSPTRAPREFATLLAKADALAQEAHRRDAHAGAPLILLANLQQERARFADTAAVEGTRAEHAARAAEWMRQAVARNPQDAHLRLEYVETLRQADRPADARQQARIALAIDEALRTFDPTSHWRLSAEDRERLRALGR
jgi:hypothetical protein